MSPPHSRYSHHHHTLLLLILSAATTTVFASFGADQLASSDLFERSTFERRHAKRATTTTSGWSGTTKLTAAGLSGVGGMQISVVSNDEIVIYDKSENNPLQVNKHSAWGAVYTISTQKVRPLNLLTNSFCAGGGWLSNGTLVSFGGNPTEYFYDNDKALNGTQAIRLFTPCSNKKCDVYENPARLRMTSNRWYPSTTRLEDGSLLVMGGMVVGGFNNKAAIDNPTMEFFPPKGNGLQFYSKFLHDALNSNLFPVTFYLPDGTIFVAANKLAMIYNWKTNTERRIASIPNDVRITYPVAAASALLPLTIANSYTPTVLMCGGSTANVDGNPAKLSSQYPASSQCISMTLTSAGIKKGWAIEQLPERRVMGDAILTPDGKVFIVNGAGSGVAGFDNVPNRIGHSNADQPVYRPCLYDPSAPFGKRFSTNFPSSRIERLYHSSASLVPDGRIIVLGSNPNKNVQKKKYKSRFEVEMFSPPYMTSKRRPSWVPAAFPATIGYAQTISIRATIPTGAKKVSVVLMELGYSTHSVHMGQRSVELSVMSNSKSTVRVKGPSTKALFPPGYGWMYLVVDGIPSAGLRIMVGPGSDPPFSKAAYDNMMKKTRRTGQ